MNICERCRAELRDDDMVVDAATYVRTDTAIGPSEVEGVHELYHVACWYVGGTCARRDAGAGPTSAIGAAEIGPPVGAHWSAALATG